MIFDILYHEVVVKDDILKLSSFWKAKIKTAIENKLTEHPELFGKPLRKSLKGYRKLRVGDYRVIFRIEKMAIKILAIQHRSVVYKIINRRIL